MLNNNYTYYKLNYPKHIVLVNNGNFYVTFDNDAIIMSSIFNYKVKEFKNLVIVGFPVNSLYKIISRLDSLKINYLVVADGIIDVSDIHDDCYDKYLSSVLSYRVYLNRISQINKVLCDNLNNPNIRYVINEIEGILCKISS